MTTPVLSLSELIAAQSQPHVPINSSLRRLDAFTNLSVLSRTNTPPGSPAEGDRYIAGSSPTGAWAGHADDVACYSGGAWIFLNPFEGLTAWNRATGEMLIYGTQSPVAWDVLQLGGAPAFYGARVERNTSQTIGNATDVAAQFNTEVFDTGGMANLGVNNDRLTCTDAGLYLIKAYAEFEPDATGTRFAYLLIGPGDTLPAGAVEIVGSATLAAYLHQSAIVELALNDYVTFNLWQDSGGNLATQDGVGAGYSASLAMQRIA